MSISIHIKKNFGGFCLQLDLEHPGGITGLLGPSGCGKSTALKCIAGIIKPDEGRIELDGRVLFDSKERVNLPPQERHVGYLFQNYALFPNMTVEGNIRCALRHKKNRREAEEKLCTMLSLMELSDCRRLYPRQISGGQQQRTALARILVSEPEMHLLDEPFSALDSYLREQMQSQIHRLLREYGKSVLLVSHSRDEIYYLCDHVAVMNRGRILRYGTVKEVFADPGSPAAALLTGCKNIAPARRLSEHEVEVPDWGVRLKTHDVVKEEHLEVGIRAHYFHPNARENLFPVYITGQREDPFESRILFRYQTQKEGTPDLWWRLPKDRTPQIMPEKLGISSHNVLLLYGEQKEPDSADG